MMDGIIKADGTSRLMRAELPATYEEFRAQCRAGAQPLDVLFNALGWSQLPTFLNKANLLKDDTAALFGLGAYAVPDDVFGVLSRFQSGLGNEYVWAKTSVEKNVRYTETLYESNFNLISGGTTYYSDSYHVESGAFVLDNPKSITVTHSTVATLRGKYCIEGATSSNRMLRPDENATTSTSGLNVCVLPITLYLDPLEEISTTVHGYVNSTDPNAYPIDDGYTYTALGQLGNKAQIATGRYTGTDTKGSSNKCSLTFDFVPKVLIITTNIANPSATTQYYYNLIFTQGGTETIRVDTDSSSSSAVVTYDMTTETVTWYASNAAYQMNSANYTYAYIAIG